MLCCPAHARPMTAAPVFGSSQAHPAQTPVLEPVFCGKGGITCSTRDGALRHTVSVPPVAADVFVGRF